MSVTKTDLKHVRKLVEDAVKEVLEGSEFSLALVQPTGNYDTNTYTMKVKVEKSVVGQEGITQEERDYRMYAPMWGVEANTWHTKFEYGSQEYKLVGVNLRKPKNCFSIVRLSDGQPRICGREFVQAGLALTKTKSS